MENGANSLTDKPRWYWWDAALVLFILFALIPLSLPFKGTMKEFFTRTAETPAAAQGLMLLTSTLVQAVVMTTMVIVLIRRRGATARDLGLKWDNAKRNIAAGLLGGFLLTIVVTGLGILVSRITGPPPPQEVEKVLQAIKNGRDLWGPFIAVAFLAPVSEEIYFRGMIYPVVRSRFGPAVAIILSSLFFGALHFDLYRLVPITIGGIGLTYMYEKTGSLMTSMIAHSTWNTLMLMLVYLAGQIPIKG